MRSIAAVRAAIDPFENALPEKSTRDAFLGFALSVLSDPRVTRSRWSNCAATEQTVRRWLTEQSLRQFFEVVDRVAPPGQWAYRHAFWNALYERGHIEEAWVVFEPTGADEAKRMYGGDISFARFGRSAGVARGHSVLLLKIGSLVVAEWSHNSSCSIWDEGQHEKGPSLYKSSYDRDALRKPIVGAPTGENLARQGVFYHNGSESYSWQKRIANYLRNRRNIELRSHEYRVPV